VIFVESATEFSTGVLAAVVALIAMGAAILIEGQYDPWRGRVWYWCFTLLGMAAALGALAQAVPMSFTIYRSIWHLINFGLGLSVALLVASAADARWGRRAGVVVLLVALPLGLAYFAATLLFAGVYFGGFLAFAAVGQLFALVAYALAARDGLAGAQLIALGLALSLAASLVAALGRPGIPLVLTLDNYGLFLLLESLAVALVAVGAARDMQAR
jgi:hypothetical protein